MDYSADLNFNNLTLIIGLVSGFFFALVYLVVALYIGEKLVDLVKKNYLNEIIQYKFMPAFKIILLGEFFVGCFIGSYIFPFFIFENVGRIKMVMSENLSIYIILSVISYIYFFFVGCYTIIITNKRLLAIFPLNAFKPVKFLLTDIKAMNHIKTGIEITLKNNTVLPIAPPKKALICYNIINELLKEGANND